MVEIADTGMKRPSKTPIWLSLAFPGAGQVAQKRWVSAIIFGGLTLVCLILMTSTIFVVVRNGVEFLTHFNEVEAPVLPTQRLIALAGLVVIVIILGVIDTVLAYLRASKDWTRARMDESMSESKTEDME
jgi:hypothetical protein